MKNKMKRFLALFLAFTMVFCTNSTSILINAAVEDTSVASEETVEPTVTPEATATPEPTVTPEADKYELIINVPEGKFYAGETNELPFTATLKKNNVATTASFIWSCDANAKIENGKLTVNEGVKPDTPITVTATCKSVKDQEVKNSVIITTSVRETYEVTGVVKDEYNNKPLEGVTVSFSPNQAANAETVNATTGVNGEYSATLYKDFTYTQTVSTDNKYETWSKTGSVSEIGGEVALKHVLDFDIHGDSLNQVAVGDTVVVGVKFNTLAWNGEAVSWKTNSDTISVTANGTVSMLKKGTATLIAECRGIEKTFQFTVNGYNNYTFTTKVTTNKGHAINEENKVYPVVENLEHNTKVTVTADITVKNNQNTSSSVGKEKVTFVPQRKDIVTGFYKDLTDKAASITSDFTKGKEFEFEASGTYRFKVVFQGEADKWNEESYEVFTDSFEVSTVDGQKITMDEVESFVYGSVNGSETKAIAFEAIVAEGEEGEYELTPVVMSGAVEDIRVEDVKCKKSDEREGFFELSGNVIFKVTDVTTNTDSFRIGLKYSHKKAESKDELVYSDVQTSTVFEVKPKTITIQSITYKDREYDGSTAANVSEIVMDVEARDKDYVSVNAAGLQYDSASAGNEHYVVLTEEGQLQLQDNGETNRVANKYVIAEMEQLNKDIKELEARATIKEKPISVTLKADLTKIYYEENPTQEEILSMVEYGNFVDGEEYLEEEVAKWQPKFVVNAEKSSVMFENSEEKRYEVLAQNPGVSKPEGVLSNYTFNLNGTNNGTVIGYMTIKPADGQGEYIYGCDGFAEVGEIRYVKKGLDNLEALNSRNPIRIKNSDDNKYNTVEYVSYDSSNGEMCFRLLKVIDEAVVAKTEDIVVVCSVDELTSAEITLKENTFAKVADILTFGIFGQKDAMKATITYADTESGLATVQSYAVVDYTTLENLGNKDAITEYLNSYESWKTVDIGTDKKEATITVTDGLTEDGHKVVIAKAVDMVGNIHYTTTSGIAIDTEKPQILNLKIEGAPNSGYVANEDDENVVIRVEGATDYFENIEGYSGIANISYKVTLTKNGKSETFATGSIWDMDAEQSIKTQEELKNTEDYTTLEKITIPVDDSRIGDSVEDTNFFVVTVTATDRAGNKSIEQSVSFDVCVANPIVDVEFNDEEVPVKNGKYFSQDRKATITVQSAYFDQQKVTWTGLEGTSIEKDWEYDEEDKAWTTVRVYSESADTHHKFNVEIADMAGNVTNAYEVLKDEKPAYYWNFVVDKTYPKVTDVQFCEIQGGIEKDITDGMMNGRYYGAGNIYAKVIIEETNFSLKEDEQYTLAADSVVKWNADNKTPDTDTNGDGTIDESDFQNPTSEFTHEEEKHILRVDFIDNANYTFDVEYVDLAGNTLDEKNLNDELAAYLTSDEIELTVDKVNPTGKITISGFGYHVEQKEDGTLQVGIQKWVESWTEFVETISFGLFSKTEAIESIFDNFKVEITGNDTTSGIHDVYYYYSSEPLTRTQLDAASAWKPYSEIEDLQSPEKVIVYAKVVDNSSNYIYLCSNGIILDDTIGTPEISPSTEYTIGTVSKGDVQVHITVTDDVSEEGQSDPFAGLYSVKYVIEDEDSAKGIEYFFDGTAKDVFNPDNSVEMKEITFADDLSSAKGTITIDADEFYSNAIKVTVYAVDRAGNTVKYTLEDIKIDNKKPEITVWDFNESDKSENVTNINCYKNEKTLTIVVDERNFDDEIFPEVTTSNQGSEEYEISKWMPVKDKEAHKCVVTFTGSGDYLVEYQTKDSAGYSSEIKMLNKFAIDIVEPKVVSDSYGIVSKENIHAVSGYFNKDVTMQFEIQERFLDAKDILLEIVKDGESNTCSVADLEADEKIRENVGLKAIGTQMSDKETDASRSKVTLTFDRHVDGKPLESQYIVRIKAIEDMLGWSAAVTTEEGIAAYEKGFYIDTKAPVQKLTYSATSKDGVEKTIVSSTQKDKPTYINSDYEPHFVAILTVEEQNFSSENVVNNQYTITKSNSEDDKDSTDLVDDETSYDRWSSSGNIYTYEMTLDVDARYSFNYFMYDNAGNHSVVEVSATETEAVATEYVTLDTINPEGNIKISGLVDVEGGFKEWINEFIGTITFGLFGQKEGKVNLTSFDKTSDVKASYYYIRNYDEKLKQPVSLEEWKDYDTKNKIKWIPCYGDETEVELEENSQKIVYQKVIDKAGNVAYYSSNVVVMDTKEPLPVVTINPSTPKNNKGVFRFDDKPGFDVVVTEPFDENNAYAGLKKIVITVKNATTGYCEEKVIEYKPEQHEPKFENHYCISDFGSIDYNAEKNFYSNEVQVTVTAEDYSTNTKVSETKTIKIDTKEPEVRFTFDSRDVKNSKYYDKAKELIITINERNFDKDACNLKVTNPENGDWSFGGWTTTGETTTGVVKFIGNGRYAVSFDCYDLAGNRSDVETLDEFVVDLKDPVVNVSYDNNSAMNGNYYKASRTATIVVTEHNFNSADVKVNGATRAVSWSHSGDKHTAHVSFATDGEYTFDVNCVDMADRKSADYPEDKFVIDLTAPKIEITGVANKSANKDVVAPIIRIDDTNYSANDVTVTLTGAQKGSVDTSRMFSRSNTETGQILSFANFADDMDDVYTLTVKSVDKAGNETPQSIMFSVNRHGSTYVINSKTKEMLDKGYTKDPVAVIIEEINVDTLDSYEISFSKDGKIVKLVENKDYTVKVEGGEGQWKKYTYNIKADCFAEEGKYNININSHDAAANDNNNKIQSFDVEFTVDKTAPTLAVSNLESGMRYDEDTHQFVINVKDNMRLSKVELYLDGKLYYTYKGEELTVENGKIYIDIKNNGDDWQMVKLIAYDEADNPTEPMEYNVLVTANKFVQFLNNKPALYGTIGGIAAVAFILFFIIWKRKKDEEEKAA